MPKRLSLALAAIIALAGPVSAEPDLGAYLAARQAGLTQDFAAAARYFTEALSADPTNGSLRDNAVTTLIAMGDVDAALPIARRMLADGQESQMANIALVAEAVRQGAWDEIFDLIEAGHEIGPLIDGLTQAWAFVGNGDMGDALEQFDEIAETPGLRSFGLLHKAFALALVGDLESVDQILSEPPDTGVVPTRGSVITHVQVLCRLGEFERAQTLIDDAFGDLNDPEIQRLRDLIAAGEVPTASVVGSPAEGVAFLFLSLAEALRGDADDAYLLIYARAAAHIDPNRASAHIAGARLLEAVGQYDLAAEAFGRVATDDPLFHAAELGRSDTLAAAGRTDAAIEVMTQLTRSHGDLPIVHASLGDLLRRDGQYQPANEAYSRALSLYPADDQARWWVTYTRGITFERMGQWPEAEADFRAALNLNPGQPSVLNYLGYSMVELGINLDEALTMIEEAATARPDSGAIVDSLGWVLFKLGRYEDSVVHMERAVELEPVDPIVTDHLGDVYWMVGREAEARFQWQRALSFDPEAELAERIRRKLDIGLFAVLEEEGVDLSDLAYDRQ